MYDYKIDNDSNGNLMPVKMFKVLLANTTILDLNNCIDKKVVFHTYNNSYIPQIVTCKVTVTHKDIGFQCSIFF